LCTATSFKINNLDNLTLHIFPSIDLDYSDVKLDYLGKAGRNLTFSAAAARLVLAAMPLYIPFVKFFNQPFNGVNHG
jgi:hypothetical protein